MNRGLASAAQELQSYGRGPDTMLAHISPSEAKFVDMMQGGRRINPSTGLPEYGLFGKVLKGLAVAAGTAVGFTLGGPAGAALGAGLATKATGGSWKQALTGAALAGVGSWGMNALSGAGTGLTTGATYGPLANTISGLPAGAITGSLGAPGTLGGLASSALPAGLSGSAANMSLSGLASAVGSTIAANPIGYGASALAGAAQPNQTKSGSSGAPDFISNQPKQPTIDEIRAKLVSQGITGERQYVPYTGDPYNYRGHTFFSGRGYAQGGAVMGLSGAVPSLEAMAMQGYALGRKRGGMVKGPGNGKSDDIPAMLSNNEHIIDAQTVAMAGDGDSDAGHKVIERIKQKIRADAGQKNPKKPSGKQRGLGAVMAQAKAA